MSPPPHSALDFFIRIVRYPSERVSFLSKGLGLFHLQPPSRHDRYNLPAYILFLSNRLYHPSTLKPVHAVRQQQPIVALASLLLIYHFYSQQCRFLFGRRWRVYTCFYTVCSCFCSFFFLLVGFGGGVDILLLQHRQLILDYFFLELPSYILRFIVYLNLQQDK